MEFLREMTRTAQAVCERSTRNELQVLGELCGGLTPQKPFLGRRDQAGKSLARGRAALDLSGFPRIEGQHIRRSPNALSGPQSGSREGQPYRFGTLPGRHHDRLRAFQSLCDVLRKANQNRLLGTLSNTGLRTGAI
jgi:hypothetical protein